MLNMNIGIVSNKDDLKDELTTFFNSKKIRISSIKKFDELIDIDYLVLNINADNWLIENIKWLVYLKEYPSIYPVIIYPNKINSKEEEILLSLGAISILKNVENYQNTKYLLRNMIYRVLKKDSNNNFINDINKTISVNGDEIKLTNTEYNLINFLWENSNETISYRDIYYEIWPGPEEENLSIEYKKYKIANVIFRLRKKLEKSKEFEIMTIRNKGYMFLITH